MSENLDTARSQMRMAMRQGNKVMTESEARSLKLNLRAASASALISIAASLERMSGLYFDTDLETSLDGRVTISAEETPVDKMVRESRQTKGRTPRTQVKEPTDG